MSLGALSKQEFLQWMKKFWDANYPGGHYDAAARRKGAAAAGSEPAAAGASLRDSSGSRKPSRAPRKLVVRHAARAPAAACKPLATGAQRVVHTAPAADEQAQHSQHPQHPQHSVALLNRTITELRLTVDEMEKERDFYFNKLRDIEVATQKITDPVLLNSDLFKQVTEILYKTEQGFEIPESGDAATTAAGLAGEAVMA